MRRLDRGRRPRETRESKTPPLGVAPLSLSAGRDLLAERHPMTLRPMAGDTRWASPAPIGTFPAILSSTGRTASYSCPPPSGGHRNSVFGTAPKRKKPAAKNPAIPPIVRVPLPVGRAGFKALGNLTKSTRFLENRRRAADSVPTGYAPIWKTREGGR
jgi:hypothetical protein